MTADSTEMNDVLVGRILNKIILNDSTTLIFNTDIGDFVFYAYGDCCSSSWIEHFESPEKPEKIVSFEEIEIDPFPDREPINDDDYDCLQQYFYKVTTDKGMYNIEMRNESNGYYGGNLELVAYPKASPKVN